MLDVDALDRADALGEVEDLGLRERLRREEAAVPLPDQRRVEALLDRRPDRERRREVVARDDEVRAVAHAHLVDLREEVVGRVPREDVREAGLDADPDEREQPGLLPARRRRELRVAEHHARQLVRPLRMALGQRHRHVEIRAAGIERRLEDRRVEPRVARVEDRVDAAPPAPARRSPQRPTRRARRGETRIVEPGHDLLGPPEINIAEHHALDKRPSARDRSSRAADATGADD